MDLLALKPLASSRRQRPIYAAVPSARPLADKKFLSEWSSRRQLPVVWWDAKSVPGWLVAWFVRPRRTRHLRTRRVLFRQRLMLLAFKCGRKATVPDAREKIEVQKARRQKIRLRPHQGQVHQG